LAGSSSSFTVVEDKVAVASLIEKGEVKRGKERGMAMHKGASKEKTEREGERGEVLQKGNSRQPL